MLPFPSFHDFSMQSYDLKNQVIQKGQYDEIYLFSPFDVSPNQYYNHLFVDMILKYTGRSQIWSYSLQIIFIIGIVAFSYYVIFHMIKLLKVKIENIILQITSYSSTSTKKMIINIMNNQIFTYTRKIIQRPAAFSSSQILPCCSSLEKQYFLFLYNGKMHSHLQ